MHNEVSPGLLSQLRKHWAQSDMVKPHICRLTAVSWILQGYFARSGAQVDEDAPLVGGTCEKCHSPDVLMRSCRTSLKPR